VRDEISGITGIVTGRCEYLYGCEQVLVTPEECKDGAPVSGTWLDERRVKVLAESVIGYVKPDLSSGGPQAFPPPIGVARGRK